MKRYACIIAILCSAMCGHTAAQQLPAFRISITDSSQTSGYYFLGPQKLGKGPQGASGFMILDHSGEVIWYKLLPKGRNILDFKIQPDNRMSYFYKDKFYFIDSNFNITDSIQCTTGITTDVHDMQVLANGHCLLIGTEDTVMDLSQYQMFSHKHSPGSTHATVMCGVIQEFDARKNLVFDWHAKDHFNFEDADENFLNNPQVVDWNHFNAIARDTDGNILLSQRFFSEITKISRQDGSIIWRWGGKRNMFKMLNDSTGFIGQHDIRRTASGSMTLMDNGAAGSPVHPAAAKEYQVDEKNMTAQMIWSYTTDSQQYSLGTGNVQRLPDGNTLIDYGRLSKGLMVFQVVSPKGQNIFEMDGVDTFISYRAFNFKTLPWRLPRPAITCFTSGGKFYLDAGGGYKSYRWSTGDTARTIEIQRNDTYYVYVPAGQGWYARSEKFVTGTHTDICGATGLEPESGGALQLTLAPNPTADVLMVISPFKDREVPVEIFSAEGRMMMRGIMHPSDSRITIQTNELHAGLYYITCAGRKGMFMKM